MFDVLIDVKNVANQDEESESRVVVSKLGQYPPIRILPDKVLINYLNPESFELYKKALLNLSQGYGIGAFAYFRRVTENLLLTFLKDIANLDYIESKKIKELLSKHEQSHDMASLVDSVFQFLPNSLKSLGNNPIRYLYAELSIGLHKLQEEECYQKAKNLDLVLTFIIKKILEEKTEISTIRKLMK